MKRVLITGGAGFIAHHLIGQILEKTEWEIVSLDRLDYSGNLNRLHDLMMTFEPEVRKRVKIVHVGTCNILDFARTCKNLERFIYFSTDEIFGPAPNGIKYKENDRYNSTNPYSATKAGGEELAVAYHNTYNLPVFITHTMNVFGERQHPEKFIPMCIKKARDEETITIHSDKTKTIAGSRHYIHAEDVASAILFLLNDKAIRRLNPDYDAPTWGDAKCPKFNIVGSEELNNLELAQIIADAQNKELKYEMVDFHSSRPGHDLRYALSGDKMKKLGWTPAKSVRERIAQVTKWTLENERWIKI